MTNKTDDEHPTLKIVKEVHDELEKKVEQQKNKLGGYAQAQLNVVNDILDRAEKEIDKKNSIA